MVPDTEALLAKLQVLDDEQDRILDFLIRHGTAVEEAQRRMNTVSVADLRPLREGLAALEETIDELQANLTVAEAASVPPAQGPDTAGESNGQTATATGAGMTAADVAVVPPSAAPPAPSSEMSAPSPGTSASALAEPAVMTFGELAARIREQGLEAARLRKNLGERLVALGVLAPKSEAAVSGFGPETGVMHPQAPGLTEIALRSRTFRLRKEPMTGDDIRAFQHDLNRRFSAWGIKLRVAEDGVYESATRLAARRVLRGLGLDLEDPNGGITPQLQRLVHKPSLRTPEQVVRAHANRIWLRRLKASAAGSRPTPPGAEPRPAGGPAEKPQPLKTRPDPAHPPPGSLQEAIRKHGGRYEQIIVREAKHRGLPVSLVCAVIEKESGFRNIYGRDRGANPNPVRSPAKGVLEVTEANYKDYLKHRRAGKDPNGVGPMQLTFPPFQDQADKLGGCWRVGPNIRVGCQVLADNIKRLGSTREGIRAYNGSGRNAEAYAADVLKKKAVWDERLKGRPIASPVTPPGDRPAVAPTPRKPRTFTVKGNMSGDDVRAWQNTLRRQFRTWRVDYPLAVDGRYGPITRSATSDVLKGLGIAQELMSDGVTPELRIKVRNKQLTARERALYNARAGWRNGLRKKFAHKGVAPPLNKILRSDWGWAPGHDGVDLICPPNAPIMALCDAEVIDVRAGGWWGKNPTGNVSKGDGIIQLKCLTDRGPFKRGMHFGYGHAEHAVVRKGQRVKAGEVIGKAGLANAWHIHFMANGGGTMKGVGDRDPMPYVRYATKRGR